MPTSPTAIERYLAHVPKPIPRFKGETPDKLYRLIHDTTGVDYRPKTPPRLHQLEGVAFALYLHRIMLLYRMRLGKTKIALDWATHLRQAKLWTRKGLVIAHAPVGLGVWEIEAQKHSNLKVVAVQKNVHEFIDALDSDADLIVVPWSGLQAMFTVRGKTRPDADGKTQNKLYADRQGIRMAAQFFSLVVIDESHRCKNHLSLRFLIAEEIVKQCKFRMIMTGTPTGRNPYALWAQAFLADEGRALGYNYYMFQQAFGHEVKNWFKPNHKEWKFDHRMLPRLRHKLSNLALSCTHSDISPDQIKPDLVELKMSTAQCETYNEVVNRLVHLPKDNLIQIRATFVRLRQAASGFLPLDDGTLLDLPGNVKLDWIEGFFEDFPDDMKVVIFHEFIHSGELIVAAAKKGQNQVCVADWANQESDRPGAALPRGQGPLIGRQHCDRRDGNRPGRCRLSNLVRVTG